MDKLINLLNKQLPSLWGLLLLLPLLKTNLPLVYAFVQTSNTNAIIIIIAWFVLYEILIYHIISPLALFMLVWIGIYFITYFTISKLFPHSFANYWNSRKKVKAEKNKKDIRSKIIIDLVKKRAPSATTITDDIAKDIGIIAGETSKYYKKNDKDMDGDLFPYLAITSFIFSVIYMFLTPNLSFINITSTTASFILFISTLLLSFISYVMKMVDSDQKLEAAFLFLTDNKNEETNNLP